MMPSRKKGIQAIIRDLCIALQNRGKELEKENRELRKRLKKLTTAENKNAVHD